MPCKAWLFRSRVEFMANEIFNIPKSDFSEWYNNVIKTADLIDQRYNIKGFIIYRPWAMRMMKQIYAMWEAELEARGHEPCLFPLVIPKENFEKEKEHVKEFSPEVFWVTKGGGSEIEPIALRPTSETAFYQAYSTWIRSHMDLPLKLYQSCTVYRCETKATKPFIRGREFLWIEAHDAFATEAEALKQVVEDMNTTRSIYSHLGIPFIFFKRPKWDKFAGAVDTYAADTIMPDGKILQLPSTHYLGQNFSKPFNITFENENGEKKHVYQTCYGPPISRTVAALIALHGDDRGLILPFDMAPIQVVIVPIIFDKFKNEILKTCNKIKRSLKKYRVEIDESNKRPGEKFYYWEMKGIPLRIEIGPKELEKKQVVISNRLDGKREIIKQSDLAKKIPNISESMTKALRKKADDWFNSMIFEAASEKDVKKILESKGGLAKFAFCSCETGDKCAEKLKEASGIEIRGTVLDEKETPKGKCIICGKPSSCIAYAGKAY